MDRVGGMAVRDARTSKSPEHQAKKLWHVKEPLLQVLACEARLKPVARTLAYLSTEPPKVPNRQTSRACEAIGRWVDPRQM